MDVDRGDAIDSLCRVCRSKGRAREAVAWATGRDGRRYYICEEHAKQLARFGRDLDDLPETPHGEPCQRCYKMTLTEDLDPAKKVCPECMGTEETANAIMEAHGGEVSTQRAVAVLNELMTADEAHVDPETAEEAVEQLTGVKVALVEDAEEA